MIRLVALCLVVAVLSACSSSPSRRFNVDRQSIEKPIVIENITIAPFKAPPFFDDNCRAAGKIAPPDRATFESYIQSALAEEIRRSGLANERGAKVALFGEVKMLAFTSTGAFSDPWWMVRVKVTSSNGKEFDIGEKYDFKTSSFGAYKACQEVADAYVPAVKRMVAKMVGAPDFLTLLVQ